MFATIWAYRVAERHRSEFTTVYGAEGVWARLFAGYSSFVGTRLYADTATPGRYLTVDIWESADAFDTFKSECQATYERLDREFAHLSSQYHLGTIEQEGAVPGLFVQ